MMTRPASLGPLLRMCAALTVLASGVSAFGKPNLLPVKLRAALLIKSPRYETLFSENKKQPYRILVLYKEESPDSVAHAKDMSLALSDLHHQLSRLRL